VTGHTALAAAATLIALAFTFATAERWRAGRRHHELAWTLALLLFTGASAALWAGDALGWTPLTFRLFYLLGAIANVPILAAGTIYLLFGTRAGDRYFAGAVLFATFAAGWVLAAPLVAELPAEGLPHGKEVFGAVPRILAAVGSGVGATILLVGAVWSAVRLLRSGPGAGRGPISPRLLALANGFIAAGTLVLSAGGLLESVLDASDAFAISLVVGVSLIFVGFLITNPPRPTSSEPAPWLAESLVEPIDRPGATRREPEAYAVLTGPRDN
jgi:hypothetical protein